MYILKYSTKYLRKKSLHSKSHIYSLPFFNMYNMGMLTIWPPCTCTHGIGSWYYIYMNIFWFLKLRDSKKKKFSTFISVHGIVILQILELSGEFKGWLSPLKKYLYYLGLSYSDTEGMSEWKVFSKREVFRELPHSPKRF